jgi:hypothetical protein
MRSRKTILCGYLLVAAPIFGQDAPQPIVVGETAVIESRILSESRPVYVATPPSYDQGVQNYGVLYVLDGDSQFQHTVSSAEFLAGFANQMIPPLLVVGIGNTNRMRDMTPPTEVQENAFLAQGGADQFLGFIVEELRPWVEKNYRTNGYSVLIGHSLGGLFALHTLFSQPDPFDSFLVIDPSVNWNNQALLGEAGVFLAGEPDLNVSLNLIVSSDDGSESDGIRRLVELLGAQEPDGLQWIVTPIVAESHDSVPLPGIYQGLKWVFSDWDVEEQAEAMFDHTPGEEILENIDDLYRRSGERFGLERQTPYLVFESLLGYLAEDDRLDEAADLTLRHSDRYPLTLVPNVIAGISQMFVDNGDEDAAKDYLSAVLDIYPGNETATEAFLNIGVEPPTQ